MTTDRHQALFATVRIAVREGWANERFWATVEQELIELDQDTLSFSFVLPGTFTTEDQIAHMISDAGAAN